MQLAGMVKYAIPIGYIKTYTEIIFVFTPIPY